MEKFTLDAGHLEKLEAAVNTDAMVEMDDVIVLLQFAQAGEKMARITFGRRGRLALAGGEDLIEGDADELRLRQAEALIQIAKNNSSRDIRARQHRRNGIFE